MDMQAAQAMIRFGLGRRGAEAPPADPRAWLAGQLEGPDPGLAVPVMSSADGVIALREAARMKGKKNRRQAIRERFHADSEAVLDAAVASTTPFRERLVWFWANHFTVSIKQRLCMPLVNAYVQEAIRPHVTGRFHDMLMAVMRHPAMLIYLDNARSIGPDSPAGRRGTRGLNENLARECLELHTVTPAAGYTQADVTEFARILTGWSVGYEQERPGFQFRRQAHEPGDRTLMGRRYGAGEEAGVRALAWLAAHPATMRNLATKLVRHFVADAPPPEAVARIDSVLRQSGGDLKAAALAVVGLDAAWQPLTKLRPPFDYVVAVLRALELPPGRAPAMQSSVASLGQQFQAAPLPNGWSDMAAEWAAPEAIMRRVDWSYAVAARTRGMDPVVLADNSLGPLLPPSVREQIARAGSQREAVTMLLAAPEFLRR
jgi:uncharacterized protein (DUF1800 family)